MMIEPWGERTMEHKTMGRRLLCALLLSMAGAGAAAQKVEVTFDHAATFKHYKSYAWGKNKLVSRQRPEVADQIEKTIENSADNVLQKKGFVLNPAKPDFYLSYSAGALPDTKTGIPTTVVPVGPGGALYGAIPGVSLDVWLEVVGMLKFSVQDASSNAEVWQSFTSKKVTNTRRFLNNMQSEIDKFVAKGLEKFPPKS
jgi:Domain of unknown function (DUF4136)